MAITRTAIVDDDGTLTTGTIINNAWKSELYDQIDASTGAVIQTTTSTGTQNNFALTTGAGVLRCNNATLLTLTGLSAGYDGQRLVILSVGAGQVDLSHQAAGSTATNRLINLATSAATSLAAGVGTAILSYDTTTGRWRLVAHDQGDWIAKTPTYAGSGAMTVSSGGSDTFKYYLRGRQLSFVINSGALTVGGTPSTSIQITNFPYSFASSTYVGLYRASDNAVNAAALFQTSTGTTTMFFFKDVSAGGNWAASAANSSLIGSAMTWVT